MNRITSKAKKSSICIATYNGSMWIEEQLNSILKQINQNDEIIIVDDCSKDDTVKIIKSIKDPRIKLFINEKNIGHIQSFEKAIINSTGEYIFMSDQDDVWVENRHKIFISSFQIHGDCVISGNTYAINRDGERIDYQLGCLNSKDSKKYKKNIIRIFWGKGWYYGCAMGFTKKIKNYIIPFPPNIKSHDLWISLIGNLLKSNVHLDEYVLKRRIHGNNASVIKRNILKKTCSRFGYIRSYAIAKKRIKKKNCFEEK